MSGKKQMLVVGIVAVLVIFIGSAYIRHSIKKRERLAWERYQKNQEYMDQVQSAVISKDPPSLGIPIGDLMNQPILPDFVSDQSSVDFAFMFVEEVLKTEEGKEIFNFFGFSSVTELEAKLKINSSNTIRESLAQIFELDPNSLDIQKKISNLTWKDLFLKMIEVSDSKNMATSKLPRAILASPWKNNSILKSIARKLNFSDSILDIETGKAADTVGNTLSNLGVNLDSPARIVFGKLTNN